MKRLSDDWKGWLPDKYYLRTTIRSDAFHSSLRSAVMEIQNRCGGVPPVEETARFLEDLARELRTKYSTQCTIDNIKLDRDSQCS